MAKTKSKPTATANKPNDANASTTGNKDTTANANVIKKAAPKKPAHAGKCRPACSSNLLYFLSGVLVVLIGTSLFAAQDEGVRESVRVVRDQFVGSNVNRPGRDAAAQGLRAKHPVVFVPGIVSTKLEVWEYLPCAATSFRQCFWGSTSMVQNLLLNKDCWLAHMSLNQTTGLDPAGIKLRPACGMAAADYLIADYWVWGKMIENLADVGYDPSMLFMAAYDWRLSCQKLEMRDAYFSRLKNEIELLHKHHGEKVVVLSHSMGGLVFTYFMQWVESAYGGNGGAAWIDTHLEAFVNIGGAMLGVPKTVSSLLSGEMKDTADLNSVLVYIKENLVSNLDLLRLFRSFGSLPSMLPKGGTAIWGNLTHAPEDKYHNTSLGVILDFRSFSESAPESVPHHIRTQQQRFRPEYRDTIATDIVDDVGLLMDATDVACPAGVTNEIPKELQQYASRPLDIDDTIALLRLVAPGLMSKIEREHSMELNPVDCSHLPHGVPETPEEIERLRARWGNPLACHLPRAPATKFYTLYGIGKPTERGYLYTRRSGGCLSLLPFQIRTNVTDDVNVQRGVRLGEGDGTVPLISLGFLGAHAWTLPLFNPAGSPSIVREYAHETRGAMLEAVLRPHETSGDHVDIMGNVGLLTDVLHIVTGRGDEVQPRIISDIVEFSKRVPLPKPSA